MSKKYLFMQVVYRYLEDNNLRDKPEGRAFEKAMAAIVENPKSAFNRKSDWCHELIGKLNEGEICTEQDVDWAYCRWTDGDEYQPQEMLF